MVNVYARQASKASRWYIRDIIVMKIIFFCIFSFFVGVTNSATADALKEEFKPQNPDVTVVIFEIYIRE